MMKPRTLARNFSDLQNMAHFKNAQKKQFDRIQSVDSSVTNFKLDLDVLIQHSGSMNFRLMIFHLLFDFFEREINNSWRIEFVI